MTDNIIVVVFPSRKVLTQALDRIMELDYVGVRRAAIVAKAANGETVILDDDITPDQGGIAGGTLGAAMGLLGLVQLGALALPGVGPIIALGAGVLVGAVVGRATGRFAANLVDFGFRMEQIQGLSERLQAGQPALILEFSRSDVLPRLRDDLRSYRAEWIEPVVVAAAG